MYSTKLVGCIGKEVRVWATVRGENIVMPLYKKNGVACLNAVNHTDPHG